MEIRSRRLQRLLDRLPDAWTVIARRARVPVRPQDVAWRPVYPYLSDIEARRLEQSGAILLATRYSGGQMELVARPVRALR